MTDWMDRMRRGDFAAAWAISDAVLLARRGTSPHHLPRHEQWVWSGAPLAGRRVLVRCHHGLGDTLMFIRYAPCLKALGCTVLVRAQPALLPLLRTVEGIDALHPLDDGSPDPAHDVEVEVMELPHAFRSTVESLPARVPYLHLPAAPRPRGGRLHVGLVWGAGDYGIVRSIPCERLAPLQEVPGVAWHVLQRGPQLAAYDGAFGPPCGSDDVLEAARHVAGLDLVITVDSMPAHLAGALAVPTWTLLPTPADWRWVDGDRSPWYPTMRLFRQPTPGDWAGAVAALVPALREQVALPRAAVRVPPPRAA